MRFSELMKIGCKPDDGLLNHYFYRIPALFVVKFLLKTPILPNHISYLYLLTGIFGVIGIGSGITPYVYGGVALLYLSFFLDHMDGPLAKAKQHISIEGKYIDRIYHSIIEPAALFALGHHAYVQANSLLFLYAGMLTAGMLFIQKLLRAERKLLLISWLRQDTTQQHKTKKKTHWFMVPIDFPFFHFEHVFLIAIITGVSQEVILGYAALTTIYTLVLSLGYVVSLHHLGIKK